MLQKYKKNKKNITEIQKKNFHVEYEFTDQILSW